MVGKVIKLGLLAGVIALIGLALFRPATLFGVDASALGNSLGGEVRHSDAHCVKQGPRLWRCDLRGSTVTGVAYTLTTQRFGCWKGSRIFLPRSAGPAARSVSGCIGLTDMLGD